MVQQIHDREVDTSEDVVRLLLADQCPQWADRTLTNLAGSGTTNTLWRVHNDGDGQDCVVRLPRRPGAEAAVVTEQRILPRLRSTNLARIVDVPELLHSGRPTPAYPMHWVVLAWIDGTDAWQARQDLHRSPMKLVADLATAIQLISSLDDLPVSERADGDRGGPLGPLLQRLDRWLDDPRWSADDMIDTVAVRRSAARSAEVVDEPVRTGTVHGDLLPGNLVTVDGRLKAIIDWGEIGRADLAQDLTPAWAVFEPAARSAFRRTLEVDEATWLRARAFELEHAVGGVLYYKPRGHLLGEVMARNLEQVLLDELESG